MPLIKRRELLFAALGLPALSLRAHAGTGPHYAARLIGGETVAGVWRAGVDITLDKGWKTYWRVPGESGVPPQFNWSRSRNAEKVTVLWPAPKRFADQAGESVGYKDRIVFPVDVVAEDVGRPIDLVLNVFLGVCDTVCIPVKLDMSLVETATSPGDASLIAAFAARVPQKVDAQSPFRVVDASLVETDGIFNLALRLVGKAFDQNLDIFVEGDDFCYFRAPRPAGESGLVHMRIDGLKDRKTLAGRPLTLTMTAGDIRLEQEVVVD